MPSFSKLFARVSVMLLAGSPVLKRNWTLSAALLATLGAGSVACSAEDDQRERIPYLIERAQQVRELGLIDDVPIIELTQDEYLAGVDEGVDDAGLAELGQTYGRLGYFDPDADLHQAVIGSREWVAGIYSQDEKRITLVGDPSEGVVVHEIVHALQDQHFDLIEFEDMPTSDAALARSAIVEGDADLAELRFRMEDEKQRTLESLDWSDVFDWVDDASQQWLDDATTPLLFMAYPSFTYTYGFAHATHTLTGITRGDLEPSQPVPFAWSREDDRFGDDARDTAGAILLLEPDVTLSAVGLSEAPKALSSRLESVDWDTLGSWYTYLLVRPTDRFDAIEAPFELAASWRGDRVLFVRDAESDERGLVWTSRWSDVTMAGSVWEALRDLHGFHLSAPDSSLGTAADGETVWLQQSEDSVVFVKNVDESLAGELASLALTSERSRSQPRRARPPLLARLGRRDVRP